MKLKRNIAFLTPLIVLTLLAATLHVLPVSAENSEKPIIVCTTNVLGSLVGEFVGDEADIVVLVRPGLCPADYDMKPSDIYAVTHAKILFYHAMLGEFWLDTLLEAAGNENLIRVMVPGDYNTPSGAKNCINIAGGNLSVALSMDLDDKIAEMLTAIDGVEGEIADEAQTLEVGSVKVICMMWLKPFVESVGFDVVATYNPPETLSAGDVTNLIETARSEGVALIIDNLQISTEFGEEIASEVGAGHVVLTNFPGAVPKTSGLTQMLQYNARQLFDGLRTWRTTRELRLQMETMESQLTIFQAATSVAVIIAIVEAVWLYMRRKER